MITRTTTDMTEAITISTTFTSCDYKYRETKYPCPVTSHSTIKPTVTTLEITTSKQITTKDTSTEVTSPFNCRKCEKTDSRGTHWIGCHGETVLMPCPKGANPDGGLKNNNIFLKY